MPFKGNVNVSDDSLEITYYCDAGYMVRFLGREHRSLKVKCLKQGQWEGYYTPVCTSKIRNLLLLLLSTAERFRILTNTSL